MLAAAPTSETDAHADPASLLDEIARIENKAKRYNTLSLYYGGAGVAVFTLGCAVGEGAGLHVVEYVLVFVGLGLLCAAFGYAAMSKGQHPAVGVLGLSCFFPNFYSRRIEKLQKQLDLARAQPPIQQSSRCDR